MKVTSLCIHDHAITDRLAATGVPEPWLSEFLRGTQARVDREANGPPEPLRPYRWFITKSSAKALLPHLASLVKRGWIKAEKSQTYALGDQELSISPMQGGHSIRLQRIPPWARTLRDRRQQFVLDLQTADGDFSTLTGEGGANEVLFPAGEGEKLFFVHGEYFDMRPRQGTLMLTAYARAKGTVAKRWEVELVQGSEPGDGTLAKYLRSRKWRLKSAVSGSSEDLARLAPLSYSSENSGDGGTDYGIVDENGHLKVVHGVYGEDMGVTLAEERWLKDHPSLRAH